MNNTQLECRTSMTRSINYNQFHSCRDGRLGSKVGQIGPKWDKSGAFSDQISVHLAPRAKCTEIWSEKAPDLSHLGPIWLTLEPNLASLVEHVARRPQHRCQICVNSTRFLLNVTNFEQKRIILCIIRILSINQTYLSGRFRLYLY